MFSLVYFALTLSVIQILLLLVLSSSYSSLSSFFILFLLFFHFNLFRMIFFSVLSINSYWFDFRPLPLPVSLPPLSSVFPMTGWCWCLILALLFTEKSLSFLLPLSNQPSFLFFLFLPYFFFFHPLLLYP